MLSFWISLGEAALLAAAVSMDAFTAGLAYGTKKIALPLLSAVIVSLVGSLMLGLSPVSYTHLDVYKRQVPGSTASKTGKSWTSWWKIPCGARPCGRRSRTG